MKKLLLVSFAFTLFVSLTALGQTTKPDDPAAKPAPKAAAAAAKETTVTGCLQKGDAAGEFAITGEDGKLFGLRSTTVKLEEHIGHKVTVAGTAPEAKADATKEKKEGTVENAAAKEEIKDLTVTSLKMVSDSCAK